MSPAGEVTHQSGEFGDTTASATPHASRIIAVWTIASRVTGLARTLVVAAVLGPTFFGNLFQTANTLPNLLYELVIGSLLVSLLVPPLVRHLGRTHDPERAGRVADGFLGVCIVVLTAVVVIIVLAGPLILRVLGAGVDDGRVLADQRRIGWPMLALLAPQTLCYCVVGVSAAFQNAHGRFALTAIAPVAENLGSIMVFLTFGVVYGTRIDFDAVSGGGVLLLCGGSTLAVAAHAAVQWIAAYRLGHALIPRAGWRDPDVRAIIKLAIPSMGYASLNALRILVMLVTAGSVAGGVVAFQFAYSFYSLPGAMIPKPIAVGSLPELARMAGSRNMNAFRTLYLSGAQVAIALLLPCVLVFIAAARPMSNVFSFGAMNSSSGRSLLAISIAGVALGILGDGRFVMASSAFYAMGNAGQPARLMLLRTVITVTVASASLLLTGSAVLAMIALGASTADLISGQLLHRKILGSLPGRPADSTRWKDPLAIALAGLSALATGIALMFVTNNFLNITSNSSRLPQFVTLVATVVLMVVTYAAVTWSIRPSVMLPLLRGGALSWASGPPKKRGRT